LFEADTSVVIKGIQEPIVWCQVIEVAAYPNAICFMELKYILTDRPMGLTDNSVLLTLQFKQLKQEHTQEFQE